MKGLGCACQIKRGFREQALLTVRRTFFFFLSKFMCSGKWLHCVVFGKDLDFSLFLESYSF